MKQAFPVSQPIEATVRFPAGLCLVTTAEEGVTVRAEPFDPGRKEDAEAAEALTVECDGRQLKITAKKKLLGKVTGLGVGRLRLSISLPAESSLTLDTDSAGIEVSDNALADLRVNTGSGPVSVDYLSRGLRVDASDSRVHAGQVDGDVSVDNGSGQVEIEVANGRVKVGGSSGDLTIGSATGSVQFSSASGNLAIATASGTAVKAKTSSGKISVGVPAGIGVRPKLKTAGGARTGALAAGTEPAPGNHSLQIEVDTASGDIDIHPAVR